jgi:S-formylglutathione hydrolase FrmB
VASQGSTGTIPVAAATARPSSTPRPTASPRPAIGQPADDGARIVDVTEVDHRTRDLRIDSPAVGTVGVRLLLPGAFEAQPTTDWPVMYLLHGATGMHADWTEYTDAEDLTKSTDLLVVMPDAGEFGFYSDWWNQGNGGPPEWETFHLLELRQLLERNWHAGDKRVVAGLSMGGYGAMEYAERKPGFFLAAASFSGALDPIGGQIDIGTDDLWGDPVAQADNWRAHDPTVNVAALKGTALYVSYGDGGKGPLDKIEPPSDDLEPWIADQNRAFVAALAKAKIPATIDAYGQGSHDWPYWERGLHESLPLLLKALD